MRAGRSVRAGGGPGEVAFRKDGRACGGSWAIHCFVAHLIHRLSPVNSQCAPSAAFVYVYCDLSS